jgi:TRAP-type mannitol/chloroaromatic compound transport system substrate-binding protein
MDRRSLIKNAGIAGVLAAGVAPAVHAQAAIRWRLASSFPKSLDTIYKAAETFSNSVKAMSGGKFEISVHAGGELMPPFGVVDGVQNGTVEAAHTAPYYFFGKDETFALGCAIPFGLNSRQMTAWMYEGNGLKLMREFYAKFNMISFPGGNTGSQMGGWYRKEIKTLADIKGMKMRIGGFGGKVLEKIGGVPQNIPGGEIYQALEKGTIDAAEWVGPYDDQKLGFNKVAPFYYYPGWWEGGPQLDFFINQKAWDSLSAENKAIVESAASHAHVAMQAKYDALNPNALKQLVGAGTKLRPFPADVMNAAFKAAMGLYEELNGRNESWKKIYADYSKFRADQNLWFRFTEAQKL